MTGPCRSASRRRNHQAVRLLRRCRHSPGEHHHAGGPRTMLGGSVTRALPSWSGPRRRSSETKSDGCRRPTGAGDACCASDGGASSALLSSTAMPHMARGGLVLPCRTPRLRLRPGRLVSGAANTPAVDRRCQEAGGLHPSQLKVEHGALQGAWWRQTLPAGGVSHGSCGEGQGSLLRSPCCARARRAAPSRSGCVDRQARSC